LNHGDPATVLAAIRVLLVACAPSPAEAAMTRVLAYLTTRWEQSQYAAFRALGYPIGSGIEARLKGSRMHGTRAQVTPMIALRAMACSDRWEQTWHRDSPAARGPMPRPPPIRPRSPSCRPLVRATSAARWRRPSDGKPSVTQTLVSPHSPTAMPANP